MAKPNENTGFKNYDKKQRRLLLCSFALTLLILHLEWEFDTAKILSV